MKTFGNDYNMFRATKRCLISNPGRCISPHLLFNFRPQLSPGPRPDHNQPGGPARIPPRCRSNGLTVKRCPVMLRLPWIISLIRRGGTPSSGQSVWLSFRGFRNSSPKISPGCTGAKLLHKRISSMIINDLDLMGIRLLPDKANPPSIINSDAVLSLSIAG